MNEFSEFASVNKADDARDFRKKCVVLAAPNVLTGLAAGASLANQNRASGNQLPAEALDAEPLGV